MSRDEPAKVYGIYCWQCKCLIRETTDHVLPRTSTCSTCVAVALERAGEETWRELERLHREWYDLRKACCDFHGKSRGPGGAAMCVCGQGGGGSSACNMLGIIRNAIRYDDYSQLKKLKNIV